MSENHSLEHIALELRRYKRVLALLIAAALIELGGNIAAGSLALGSDAIHVVTDNLAVMVAIVQASRARQKVAQTEREALRSRGAQIGAVLLLLASGIIGGTSLVRLARPHPVHGDLMLLFASLGMAASFGAYWILRQCDCEGCLPLNTHAKYDIGLSLGVILSAAAIHFLGWTQVDAGIGLGISVWVGWLACRQLQGMPAHRNHHGSHSR